jgi:hypothetical protein
LLARRPQYAKRIGSDVGQGARPGQAEQGATGIIQSSTPDTVLLVPVDH